MIAAAVDGWDDGERPVRRSSTGSSAPTARSAGCSTAASSSRARAAGCGWTARCSTSPSGARPRRRCAGSEIEAARTEELRASRARIVEAADEARRKIERDLHDGAQQRLVALALDVRVARRAARRRPGRGRPVPRPARRRPRRRDRRAARAGPRHPSGGADRARPRPGGRGARRRAPPCPSRWSSCPTDRLPPTAEVTAYFTVAEALTNVAKYAQATHVTVRLARVGRRPRGRGPRRRDRRRRRRRRARGSAAWPIASAPPTGRSRWSARRGRGRWSAR